jgi:tRNA A-37 threonylcarbamoyl transferase component Bud32
MRRFTETQTMLGVSEADPKTESKDPPEPQSGLNVAGGSVAATQPSRGAIAADAPMLDSDRFTVLDKLGEGGSSVVYRGFDREILREVAIKILKPELSEEPVDLRRFTEEARILGGLEHPNIVPIYDYGADKRGQRYLCMKVVAGQSLHEKLLRQGEARLRPENLAELLQILVKVCDAISFAHSRGVIHRDLKPSNVMLSDYGQVYVVDFGVARQSLNANRAARDLDVPGKLLGTFPYTAPEQLQGRHDAIDPRTDVFSLGATLYQVLTGRPPLSPEILAAFFMRTSPPEIPAPEQFVPKGGVPVELSRIALRCMAYEPAERYPSVVELKRDIELFQRGSWDVPRRSFAAGSIIVREGDPGMEAYVIAEGQCSAFHSDGAEEMTLRVMGPGEVFGETAIFSEKPRSASVKAVTDVVLLVVTVQDLSSGVGLNSWMGTFVKALADRFREVDERLRAYEQALRQSVPPSTRRGN